VTRKKAPVLMVLLAFSIGACRRGETQGIPRPAEEKKNPRSSGRTPDPGLSGPAVQSPQNWFGILCEETATGKYFSDKHGLATCASKTKGKSASFVLVSEGNAYKLQSEIRLAMFVGEPVLIVGSRIGNVIKVGSVKRIKKKELPGYPGGRLGGTIG